MSHRTVASVTHVNPNIVMSSGGKQYKYVYEDGSSRMVHLPANGIPLKVGAKDLTRQTPAQASKAKKTAAALADRPVSDISAIQYAVKKEQTDDEVLFVEVLNEVVRESKAAASQAYKAKAAENDLHQVEEAAVANATEASHQMIDALVGADDGAAVDEDVAPSTAVAATPAPDNGMSTTVLMVGGAALVLLLMYGASR